MRVFRSILCAGLAVVAAALCASMPAAAAVPIDVSVAVQMTAMEIHPAPALHVVLQDVAVLPSVGNEPAGDSAVRSLTGNASPTFADNSIVSPAYLFIDPDIEV